jgi:metal-responsive CopG/Arc/MetJ family transcriptional regulator
MPTEKPQFSIVMDKDTLEKVEDFRFSERFPNRSQAINYLVKKGMEAIESEKEKEKKE